VCKFVIDVENMHTWEGQVYPNLQEVRVWMQEPVRGLGTLNTGPGPAHTQAFLTPSQISRQSSTLPERSDCAKTLSQLWHQQTLGLVGGYWNLILSFPASTQESSKRQSLLAFRFQLISSHSMTIYLLKNYYGARFCPSH
jgi:hypothetical protein